MKVMCWDDDANQVETMVYACVAQSDLCHHATGHCFRLGTLSKMIQQTIHEHPQMIIVGDARWLPMSWQYVCGLRQSYANWKLVDPRTNQPLRPFVLRLVRPAYVNRRNCALAMEAGADMYRAAPMYDDELRKIFESVVRSTPVV